MLDETFVKERLAKTVDNSIEIAFKYLSGKVKDFNEKSKIDLGISFVDYLNNSFEKYSKIKTILYKNQPKYLYDFFECCDLKLDREIVNCQSVESIISISRFSIIVGLGGMGKSTLMKHFFLDTIEKNICIPLFIELRNYDNSTNLLDYCYNSIKVLGFRSDIKYFKYALESGIFLFLLDGYDEIKDELRAKFRIELFELSDEYNKNAFIISSRPCDTFIGWTRFSVFKTQPLSKSQAINLINKIDYDKDTKDNFIRELNKKLYYDHQSFASNPLLLNILLLTYDEYAKIPEKLHIFYSKAFDTMYSIHDATKPGGGYKRDLKSKLPSDSFIKVFSKFCFITYVHEQISFDKHDILTIIDESSKKIVEVKADDFLDDLQNAVCLIYLDGLKYIFTHRSFQEYFSAIYLRDLNDDSQQIVCQRLLKKNLISIHSDSVFSMLWDMNTERFNRNVVLPTLKEIKDNKPIAADELHSFFYYLVDYIELIPEKYDEKRIDDVFEKRMVLFSERGLMIAVKFNENINYNFIIFLAKKYMKIKSSTINLGKLFSNYINKTIDANLLRKDNALFSSIISETKIGKIVKNISKLYDEVSKEELEADLELKKLLDIIE